MTGQVDVLRRHPNGARSAGQVTEPPDRLQDLLDKLGSYDQGFTGWSDAEIRDIAAPTLITVGDCDAVTLEHAVRFLQLRGGDVNGDFVGVPASSAVDR